MAEDGRVEYEVRADLSHIDNDLDKANEKIVSQAEKGAKKQEETVKKSQENISRTVKKTNDEIETDSDKTQKSITTTAEKQSDKIVQTEKKNKKAITRNARSEGDKVVSYHKQDADKIVKTTEEAAGKIEKTTSELRSKIGSIGKGIAAGIGTGLAAGAVAVGGAAVSAVSSANDLDKSVSNLTASLGLTAEEAKKYDDVIKKIYGNNYGESFEEIAYSLSLIKQQMTDITDDELQKVTESAYLLADVYDMDIAQGIRGANALVKQFGVSAEEAYNLLAQGAEKGLNQNGDLADQLAEYSIYYADMGFSAEEAMSMLVSGAKNGAYQIDFLNDAFKEFSICAKDGSQTTADGLALLGLDAEKLTAEFAAGGDSAYQAFKLVNEQLAACDDDVARNAAGVALYGTKWEDLGEDAIFAMAQMGNSIDLTRDKLAEMSDVKYNSLSEMVSSFARTAELLLIPLGESLIPLLKDVIESLAPIVEDFLPQFVALIQPIVTDLSELIAPVMELVSDILPQFVELLKPILSVVSEIIQKIMPVATKLFEELLPPLIQIVENLLPPLLNVVDALLPMLNLIIDLLTPILTLIANLSKPIGDVISAVGQIFSALETLRVGGLEPLISLITGIADLLTQILIPAITAVSDVFSGLVSFLSGNIMGGLQNFGNSFIGLFQSVLGAIDQMFSTSLQKWYDETQEACRKIGEEMYAATHQEEIRANELSTKYHYLSGDMNEYIVDQLRQGKSASEALRSAKDKYLTSDEINEYFTTQLADKYINEEIVQGWYDNIRANNGLYSQGFTYDTPTQITASVGSAIAEEERRKGEERLAKQKAEQEKKSYRGAEASYTYTPSTYTYTPSTYSLSDYAYNFNVAENQKQTSYNANKSAYIPASASEAKTINITSYVPTVWDDVNEANRKLARGIGAAKVGNSKTGKIISGISSADAVITSSAEKADATLNDVVSEIKSLKSAQEKMQYTLDVTLKTNEYTLAKATVKGIKQITKQEGKSPL